MDHDWLALNILQIIIMEYISICKICFELVPIGSSENHLFSYRSIISI